MVDWKAVLSGKTIEDVGDRLSQLTDAEQQQVLQQFGNGNLIVQPPTPVWRLVILNNKSRVTPPYAWGPPGPNPNWPHQLMHHRNPVKYQGDNTLVLAKTLLTFLRIGLLPLGPNPGPNQPAERVTISLHMAPSPGGAPITAAELSPAAHAPWLAELMPPPALAPPAPPVLKWPQGKPIFVTNSPSTPNKDVAMRTQVAMPTTQALSGHLPTQQAICPWGLPQVPEQQIGGLLAHVAGLHDVPNNCPMLQARLAALQQADADSQQTVAETTYRFYFNVTPQADITGCNQHTRLFLRVTLVSDPNVFVDTEHFLLESRKHEPSKKDEPPKENVGSNKRPAHSSTGSGKKQKSAGLSAGAGPSSLGAAGSSSDGGGGAAEAVAEPEVPAGSEAPAESEAEAPAVMEEAVPRRRQSQRQQGQLPENPALDLEIAEAVAPLNLQTEEEMADGQEDLPGHHLLTPADLAELGQVMMTAMHEEAADDDGLGELGDFDQEPNLDDQGQPPDGADGGGAGYSDLSAGGDDSAPNFQNCAAADDSAPSFTPCSASEGTGGAYRSLGATTSDDAGGEAGLDSRQSAMRRVRRAKRDTAKALLLAILQAAGAQQQQQPGATPLAQLKEELETLKAWLGL